ncbi:anti-sigma F factor [Parablautia intestinalis]|jgi:stage II sporulation protein AB (anti-sigma F factor)|uniref:Anti-sigma F factor n=1 Tax=Parablautia intestinalis TaxID=2320100 RepID=A0A3A9AQT6_9FIRM|nr:anti-sigma F factor [Parablautia intestinalis]MCI8614628.1 anti-sigma F factor [Lachnospiraceae bacterium]RKI89893.1 anti-sigma F factor [Parablautia intestinalis]
METKNNTILRNEMEITFDAISVNEAFARVAVAAFVTPLNPTMEEVSDIKTAVSEAVTNAIIHGYDSEFDRENHREEKNQVYLHCIIEDDVLEVEVRDKGKGIENIEQAMEPLFTTKPELDRSGMGFAFMEAFMDDLEVNSGPGYGTSVVMKKKLGTTSWILQEE